MEIYHLEAHLELRTMLSNKVMSCYVLAIMNKIIILHNIFCVYLYVVLNQH